MPELRREAENPTHNLSIDHPGGFLDQARTFLGRLEAELSRHRRVELLLSGQVPRRSTAVTSRPQRPGETGGEGLRPTVVSASNQPHVLREISVHPLTLPSSRRSVSIPQQTPLSDRTVRSVPSASVEQVPVRTPLPSVEKVSTDLPNQLKGDRLSVAPAQKTVTDVVEGIGGLNRDQDATKTDLADVSEKVSYDENLPAVGRLDEAQNKVISL